MRKKGKDENLWRSLPLGKALGRARPGSTLIALSFPADGGREKDANCLGTSVPWNSHYYRQE